MASNMSTLQGLRDIPRVDVGEESGARRAVGEVEGRQLTVEGNQRQALRKPRCEEAKRRGRMHTRCPSSQILPPTVRVFCALEMAT